MQPIQMNEIPKQIIEYVNGITSMKFPRQGYTSDVAIIESTGHFYALKRTKDPLYTTWLNKEVAVLNILSATTTLPVPKVLKFIMNNDKNQAWALLEFIEGQTLRSALLNENNLEIRTELILKFGEVLRLIHSIPCPKGLTSEEPWLVEMLSKAEHNLTNHKTDGTLELLERIKTKQPTRFKQTLIHGDYTIDNVLVHNGQISGIIDWAGGAYGDPRYDVSLAIRPKPNAFQSIREQEIFFEGYGEKIIDKSTYDYYVNGLYEFA